MADRARAYAEAVAAGEIVAGPWVRLAAARHLADLDGGAARGLTWDRAAADHAIDFFERFLLLPTGQPFLLSPWQAFIVGSLFGWQMDGHRRYRTAYIEVGKGGGKTPLSAGIGLYGLVADSRREPAAEVYVAATTREQANIGFRDARLMAQSSPALARLLDVGEHNIAYAATNSFMRPVSSEHRGLDGKRVHIGLIDELHEHPNAMVVGKIAAGTKGRRSPLIVEITNSGWDRQSICWQHHEYSLAVLEGRAVDETWFGYVCALDAGDDWRDPAVWPKANPNLGVSITETYLAAQVAAAEGRPAEQSLICRLNFCIWTEGQSRWLDMARWDACAGPVPWRELPAHLAGRECFLGLDLASTTDLAALEAVFPDHSGDEVSYDVLTWAWCPEEAARERSRRSGVPYEMWARDGALLTTPGDVIDYAYILRTIREIVARYRVIDLGYDRWGSTKLEQDLKEIGFTDKEGARARRMTPLGQGFATLSAPTKEVGVLVATGRLRHGGHPVLRWAAGNVVTEEDAAGNVKPSKDKSSEKIDPMAALVNAVERAMWEPAPVESVYRTRGILTV